MNILVIGSGGREHALAWKIKQSPLADEVYILPGNAGTARTGINIPLSPADFKGIRDAALALNIGLMVIGPEQPLVDGLTDYFAADDSVKHIPVIGPGKKGAQLEGSKDFAKQFMTRHKIPTAAYHSFSAGEMHQACAFLDTLSPPYVLKADGLAAGKGVIITDHRKEAEDTIGRMFAGLMGSAGKKIVIEQYLQGIELSVFVITDGKSYLLLPEAKDYKRIGENDTGPNTGGMGAVSPVPFADAAFMSKVENRIIQPTIRGLSQENIDYKGFIFFGLINVQGEPWVIEYNARMGDPETEAVLPRITSDLLEILLSVHQGNLSSYAIQTDPRPAVTVIMASGGYPGDYRKGFTVSIPENIQNSIVFHAGTAFNGADVITSGGRVLAVTSLGSDHREARSNCYRTLERIHFEKAFFRRDIGLDIIQ